MTSTPQQPDGDQVQDQDAEPTMNAPADERPDGQEEDDADPALDSPDNAS